MIRCIYMRFIAPPTIYLGRSSPCHVRCSNVTCSFFFFLPFLPSQFQRGILGCVRSNNFESSPDRSSLVIHCDYPVLEYKESGRIEFVVSYLFCQAQLAPLQHERRMKQMQRNCNWQLNPEWEVKTIKGGQKNFPRDDNINGTNFKICQVPD